MAFDPSIFNKNKDRQLEPSYTGKRVKRTLAPVKKAERFTPPNGWNDQFEDIFDFVVNGEGHGAIEAVAGGGKTTALVEAIIRYCEANPTKRVCFVAFNVSIKEEGQKRLQGYPVDVMTCHGMGYRATRKPSAWGDEYGKRSFDIQDSNGDYMMELANNQIGFENEKEADRQSLLSLVSKAKTCLVDDVKGIVSLMERFGIDSDYPKTEFAQFAKNILDYNKVNMASKSFAPRRAKKPVVKGILTFDDQVWLPVVNKWDVDKYDAVFVDEAQDLSPARRELIKMAMKDDARIFLVGDRFQAIYSFAGADTDSLPNMIKEFKCKVLPLSCSWRCASKVIESAQSYNENIYASDSAEEGVVDRCKSKDLLTKVKPGDVIISRKNAPLVLSFFKLAKQQRRVQFIGKEYGKMLKHRVRSWQHKHEQKVAAGNASEQFTANTLLEYNREWLRACASVVDGEMVTANERQRDEYETVVALTEGLANDKDSVFSIHEILDRCDMFSPVEDADNKNVITFSSTHRFKGLEADHVYMLADTYLPKPSKNKPVNMQEEKNLVYTAITRAKRHLTYVTDSGN